MLSDAGELYRREMLRSQLEDVTEPTEVTISLDRIDIGGTITLTYELENDETCRRTQVSLRLPGLKLMIPGVIQIVQLSPLPQLSRQI